MVWLLFVSERHVVGGDDVTVESLFSRLLFVAWLIHSVFVKIDSNDPGALVVKHLVGQHHVAHVEVLLGVVLAQA